MKKNFFSLILCFSFLLFWVPVVFAQETARSNDVITQIGNPTGPKPIAKSAIQGRSATQSGNQNFTPINGPQAPGTGETGKTFYCQGDPKWENGCDMAGSGCGPTSMAMVLSSFGDTITPKEMDALFRQRGWRGCGAASYMTTAIETLSAEKGYTYKQLKMTGIGQLDLIQAAEYLKNGYLIIGSVPIHIFVVDSVDVSKNTVTLRDPASCSSGNGSVQPNAGPWRGYGWYYAYAIKKTK